MHELFLTVKLGVMFLLWGLLLVVAWQIITGKIAIRGLLKSRTNPSQVDPSKTQMLAITLTTAFFCVFEISKNPAVLPAIPSPMLYLAGGSNVLFVASKFIQYRLNKN